jgi:tRNA/tmRNA/rRNA uracil-C5-methylase (TrmA/RlmC/RlmD family)
MRLTIEKLVYPGRSLAALDGKVVFTDDGLPGEIVEAENVGDRKNLIEAHTVRIVRPSPDRVVPRCAHYKACSPYQAIAYGAQIEAKRSQLIEILAGLPSQSGEEIDFVPSPDIWHYRNKVRFTVTREGAAIRFAYNVPGSRDAYVPVEECHLVSRPVTELLAAVLAIIRSGGFRTLAEVEARVHGAGHDLLLNLFWSAAPLPREIDALVTGLAGRFPIAGIASLLKAGKGWRESLEWGRGVLEEEIGSTRYRIGARSFFQVNVGMLGRVLEDVAARARFRGDERLVDLYCGVGTFGLALAGSVKEVLGIESEAANIAFLRQNVALNKAANFKIFEGSAEEWAPTVLAGSVDAAIFDPPRKGLESEIVTGLLESPPRRVFYLSCNPTTLARDLKALSPVYALKIVRGYDFFPHTPHIEALAVLERK